MSLDDTSRLQQALDDYAQNIERFKRGEITADQFRPLRLGMGVYAQLAHVKHMQRVKLPGLPVEMDGHVLGVRRQPPGAPPPAAETSREKVARMEAERPRRSFPCRAATRASLGFVLHRRRRQPGSA